MNSLQAAVFFDWDTATVKRYFSATGRVAETSSEKNGFDSTLKCAPHNQPRKPRIISLEYANIAVACKLLDYRTMKALAPRILEEDLCFILRHKSVGHIPKKSFDSTLVPIIE
jgi:hypothetical protein